MGRQAKDFGRLLSVARTTSGLALMFPELRFDRDALRDTIISEAVGVGVGWVYDAKTSDKKAA
jgi:hypothetical protein